MQVVNENERTDRSDKDGKFINYSTIPGHWLTDCRFFLIFAIASLYDTEIGKMSNRVAGISHNHQFGMSKARYEKSPGGVHFELY